MTRSRLVSLVVGLALHGCSIAYVGGARAVDPLRLTSEPGWITAQPTVEIRQRDATDCGPAALSMLAARWGLSFPLAEAIEAVPAPTKRGIRLGDLRAAARERGLDAYAIRGDPEILVHELREGRPVIIGLLLRHRLRLVRSHYELVVAFNERTDEIVSVDPAAGFRIRSVSALDEEWEPAGRPALVVVGPLGAVDSEPVAIVE